MKWILRILLALVAIVVIAAVGIYAAGLREGSDAMSVRVEIDKPVAAVWKHFNDPVKTKAWVSWLVEIKEFTPGNKVVGTKEIWIIEDRNNNNERMEILAEVTAIDPQRRIDLKLSVPSAFDGTATYLFEDLGGGRSAVTSAGTYRLSNAFAQYMLPVVMKFARDKLVGDMQHLKSNVEKE